MWPARGDACGARVETEVTNANFRNLAGKETKLLSDLYNGAYRQQAAPIGFFKLPTGPHSSQIQIVQISLYTDAKRGIQYPE